MNHRELPRVKGVPAKKRALEGMDLLKEVFVCISIPVVAFAFAYIALDTFLRLFLG